MHFFSACIVNIWNVSVVDTCTVNAFTARLDKFWQHQIVKFDFTADLCRLQETTCGKPIRRTPVVIGYYCSFYDNDADLI